MGNLARPGRVLAYTPSPELLHGGRGGHARQVYQNVDGRRVPALTEDAWRADHAARQAYLEGVRHERDVGPGRPVHAFTDYLHHAKNPDLLAPAPRAEILLLKPGVEVLDQ